MSGELESDVEIIPISLEDVFNTKPSDKQFKFKIAFDTIQTLVSLKTKYIVPGSGEFSTPSEYLIMEDENHRLDIDTWIMSLSEKVYKKASKLLDDE